MIRHLAALPRAVRIGLFAAAVGVILVICILPESALPKAPLWDKLEHSLAWATLTIIGISLSPRRWKAIALFALGLGLAVEVIQAIAPTGRQGDWRDFLADAVGVLIGVRVMQIVQKIRARRAGTRP